MTTEMSRMMRPKFTVLYNIVVPGAMWIGTGWEFFDDQEIAQARYDYHVGIGNVPTMRPYNHKCDFKHLGTVHVIAGDGPEQEKKYTLEEIFATDEGYRVLNESWAFNYSSDHAKPGDGPSPAMEAYTKEVIAELEDELK